MSTKKRVKGQGNPRDPVDAVKAKAQAARAAVEESLDDQDEALLRAEADGQAVERNAERAKASEPANPSRDKYFEIDKRVAGAEITMAEALAEAGEATHRHHPAGGSKGKDSQRSAG